MKNIEIKTVKKICDSKKVSLKWLQKQLKEKGIERDYATISLYCSGAKKPRDRYVIMVIAEILEVSEYEISLCFIHLNK